MANEVKIKKNDRVFYTQKELSKRWRLSEATIKKLREKGHIPCFFPPGSSRVLYPVDGVIQIEQEKKNQNQKEIKHRKKRPETNVKKPVSPAESCKEWRI